MADQPDVREVAYIQDGVYVKIHVNLTGFQAKKQGFARSIRGKFNGNHWELYAYGKPVGKGRLADLNRAKNPTLYSIARWVDSELVRHPRMKVFLRTMSPKHFVNDNWNTGGSCGNTIPLSNGSEVLQDHSSDLPAERAVNGTQVKLLDITAISQVTTTRRGAYLKL